ncbi:MAG: lipopolysaccharide biosynthesis protein [Bacteroidota bacterium]
MGIVKRQSIRNAAINYAGVMLGYVNKVLLFQQWLTEAEYGLVELLIAFMVIGSEISQLGVSKLIIRFFGHFQRDPQKEGQFTTLVLLYGTGGFLLICSLIWLGKDGILQLYEAESALFASYMVYVLPMIFAHLLYRMSSSLARAQFITVLPMFAWELLLRMWHLVSILIYVFGEIELETFIQLLVVGYFLPSCLLLIYLATTGRLRLSWQFTQLHRRIIKVLIGFALFASLSEATMVLVNKTDMAMLGAMLGEAKAGAYALAFYFSMLVFIPYRSLNAIVVPLIATHMRSKNLPEVGNLFRKTSAMNLVIGSWVFIGIWTSIDEFYALFPKHAEGKWAVFFLGISAMVQITAGLQRSIIVNSRYYRFDLFANLGLLTVVVLSNYLLIPLFQVPGAAIATAGSLSLYSLIGVGHVYYRFRIHPFSWRSLGTVLLCAAVMILGQFLPELGNPWLNILGHSVIVTVVFLPLAIRFRLAPELNTVLEKQWKQLQNKLFPRK